MRKISMIMRVRLILAMLFGLAMILGLAPSVVADQPEKVVIRDIHIIQTDETTCDFPFLEEFEGTVTITTYFDNAGNPVKVKLHLPFHGTLTNEANGKSVSADQVLIVFQDLEAGTETLVGVRFRVTFPGLGAILLDVGRVVFDAEGNVIFEAGPHQIIHEDFEAFCAALG